MMVGDPDWRVDGEKVMDQPERASATARECR